MVTTVKVETTLRITRVAHRPAFSDVNADWLRDSSRFKNSGGCRGEDDVVVSSRSNTRRICYGGTSSSNCGL